MGDLGTGEMIYSIRKKIQDLQSELTTLDQSVQDVPELISSANLLRSNEHLSKINEKKTELISYYVQYSEYLENMLSTVFDIQNDLKNILKEQSVIINDYESYSKSTKKSSPKKPTKKKISKT